MNYRHSKRRHGVEPASVSASNRNLDGLPPRFKIVGAIILRIAVTLDKRDTRIMHASCANCRGRRANWRSCSPMPHSPRAAHYSSSSGGAADSCLRPRTRSMRMSLT